MATKPTPALAAVVYPNEAYPQAVFEWIAVRCRARGMRLAGVLQHPVSADADRRCDVVLEDLLTGERTDLFERRGSGASGCRLDIAALTDVTASIERALASDLDLLLLNKFGKVEADGGGLVDPIALAVDRGIPVIIGVPVRNLEAWRNFAGDLSVELAGDLDEVASWLDASLDQRNESSPLLCP